MKGSSIRKNVPLTIYGECRARKVSLFQRFLALIFGAPNARRANGIIYAGCDVLGFLKRAFYKICGKSLDLPVFEIDRIGTMYDEVLPRIWLTEEIANVSKESTARIFVECYPAGPDVGGERALELGDRYLGEGMRFKREDACSKAIECFQAAEILYLHAVRRGNRHAARQLREMYLRDLCKGQWHMSYIYIHAKHAPKPKIKLAASA